jgi:hypothetical protein
MDRTSRRPFGTAALAVPDTKIASRMNPGGDFLAERLER